MKTEKNKTCKNKLFRFSISLHIFDRSLTRTKAKNLNKGIMFISCGWEAQQKMC